MRMISTSTRCIRIVVLGIVIDFIWINVIKESVVCLDAFVYCLNVSIGISVYLNGFACCFGCCVFLTVCDNDGVEKKDKDAE